MGQQVPLSGVRSWAEAYQGNEAAVDTFERFAAYLKQNKIDLDKTAISLGPTLAFDSASETFKDSDAANAMLTREYRKPFVVPAAGQV